VVGNDPTTGLGALPSPVVERLELDRPDVVYDESSPFALVNMVSGKLRDAIMRVPLELRVMNEAELKSAVEFKPTRADYALRTSFWREFDKAAALGRDRIVTSHIFAGIVTEPYFYQHFLEQPHRVAWLVLPQQTYSKEMEAILARGTERLWELMEMDVTDAKGKVDSRKAEVLLKVISEVKNRVKGMAVQRVNKQSVNLNLPAGNRAVPVQSMEELKKRLAELEGKSVGDRVAIAAGDHTDLQAASEDEEREIVVVATVRPGGSGGGD
jgi:hypothetical protein